MRNWFLTRILQRKALRKIDNPHHGKYIPLRSARRAGLVISADIPGAAEAMKIFCRQMVQSGIEYRIFCLDLNKKVPLIDQSLISDRAVSVIHRKDLNWYGMPKAESSRTFLQQPFDILVDMTSGKRPFPADYILRQASASLRIGIESNRTSQYDMTVCGKDDGAQAPELIKNIIKYLTTIH
ncbi:MAG TPA: hypothetical protein IAC03_02525 [Candidatus Coprenecus pullistercoris]|nr:hypothetical protein [Candidatus Coprenecus pullistercoris]